MIAKKIPGFEVTESVEPGRSLGYEWSHLVENTVCGPLSCCASCVSEVKGHAQNQHMDIERPAN